MDSKLGATRNRTQITVRLSGTHETELHPGTGSITVIIPDARITLASKAAALSVSEVWEEAQRELRNTFGSPQLAAPYLDRFDTRTDARLVITDRVEDVRVYTKAPALSPSGCGQLTVQIGQLTIICDDLAAAAAQLTTWQDTKDLIDQVWPAESPVLDLDEDEIPF